MFSPSNFQTFKELDLLTCKRRGAQIDLGCITFKVDAKVEYITFLGTENQKTDKNSTANKVHFTAKNILFLNFKYISGTWKISILDPPGGP